MSHDEQDFLESSAHAGDTSPYRRDGHWGADLVTDDETATTLTAVRAQIRANFSERFPTRNLPEWYDIPKPIGERWRRRTRFRER